MRKLKITLNYYILSCLENYNCYGRALYLNWHSNLVISFKHYVSILLTYFMIQLNFNVRNVQVKQNKAHTISCNAWSRETLATNRSYNVVSILFCLIKTHIRFVIVANKYQLL